MVTASEFCLPDKRPKILAEALALVKVTALTLQQSYPMEPFEKAKARRLVHIAEVYIDTPARDILMKDFVQFSQSESRLEEIQQQLHQAAGAVAKLAPPSPWMMGEQFTIADIFLYYTLLLMMPPVEKHTGVKLLDFMPGYSEWFERFSERELSRKVAEPLEEDWARFRK